MKEFITKIKKLLGIDEATRAEKLRDAAIDRANRIYTIRRVGKVGIVFLDGKPISLDYDTDAEHRLYNLRDSYVEECMKLNELL